VLSVCRPLSLSLSFSLFLNATSRAAEFIPPR
jgi:hypothetical protein